MSISSEHLEQVAFVRWFRGEFPDALIFAIPNGELRSISVAKRLKAEGVVSGIPDLCCIFPYGVIVWVEMKKSKGGAVSKDQKQIHLKMDGLGQTVIIGYGCDDARNKLQEFLKFKNRGLHENIH